MTEQTPGTPERLPIRDASTWLVLAPAVGLVLLGALFIVAPRLGAAVFGIPAPEGPPAAYLAAIGLRDVAFGLYIAALALFSTRHAVALVLGITVLIPLGDILIVLAARGLSPGHLLAHAASGLYMAGASVWLMRSGRPVDGTQGKAGAP